ncbi:transferase family-domain-containing protein [Aspergillus pseudotamarii]|uniref:Transferase family-domain-containing protein n=1 Tax=Aspergillus pseudotamarii TaxID=132259 RepID=A0A5N6TA46_ASPPS|nr:transferase family-domain-containing protein [Aspergillus pseudotamarii]KAE8143182.1 transferase family-domain-containing protein [Aspergillus pseudotamarii]
MDPATLSTCTTLGCLDDIMPDIDLPMILSFACPTTHYAITEQNLRRSFTELLGKSPWLRGYIHSNVTGLDEHYRKGTKLFSHIPDLSSNVKNKEDAERIEFQDLSSHTTYKGKTYPELVAENMPASYLSPELLVPNRATKDANVKYALQAKVSFIREGVFIVLSTSHALMDATSLAAIFGAWAALSRGEEPTPLSHSPVLGPELDFRGRSGKQTMATEESNSSDCRGEKSCMQATYEALKVQKHLWHMMGLDYRPKEMSSAVLAQRVPSRSTVTKIFKITAAALARLKVDCSIPNGSEDHGQERGWISTNDALSALLWRCIVRARIAATPDLRTRTSSVMCAMDMRNSPVLAPRATQTADEAGMARAKLANIVLYSIERALVPELVESSSLSDTARGIRTAMQKYTESSHVSRALQLAAAIPDVSALGLVYPTWLEHDVVISSLARLPLYNTPWGDTFGDEGNGVPDIVRWPERVFEGVTFVMPRRRDGSVEIVLTMGTADMKEMDRDKEWSSYAENVA